MLSSLGVRKGDRIAVLSENRSEYIELELAAAKIGAIVACCNWRQAKEELEYCIDLVDPKLLVVSERFSSSLTPTTYRNREMISFGVQYEAALERIDPTPSHFDVSGEDGLIILFTSGTTGLPKAALISNRAMVMRSFTLKIDIAPDIFRQKTYLAWTPFFHMTAADFTFAALMNGGKVIVNDGFDPKRFVDSIVGQTVGNLVLLPGMIDRVIDELKASGRRPLSVQTAGIMADLVPPAQIAEITTLLQAPYRNTFGSTETGSVPAGTNLIPIGITPSNLSKYQSSCCDVRLVDENDNEVARGEPGELIIRTAGLFSGYWNAPEANEEAFRGGWYHMGDIFVRNADGTLDFVDRRKYLIKSGGENIYPAEIERILLASSRINDAAVVRMPDAKWGEIPVAFVAKADPDLTDADIIDLFAGRLARYKFAEASYLCRPV